MEHLAALDVGVSFCLLKLELVAMRVEDIYCEDNSLSRQRVLPVLFC